MEDKMSEIYSFNRGAMFKGNKDIINLSNTFVTQIIDTTDNVIKNAIIEYARKYALEKDKNIKLILLDEEKVKEIIDLGIEEYIGRKA